MDCDNSRRGDFVSAKRSNQSSLKVKYPNSRNDDADSPFMKRSIDDAFSPATDEVHSLGGSHICATGGRGYVSPDNKSPLDLVVDASEGFIPLWAKAMHLRWRFDEQSFNYFQNADAAKSAVKQMFAEAVALWGDSAPIAFSMSEDVWDFEISMRPSDRCGNGGCVLASAFFPDGGRHQLSLYPKFFAQSRKEQIETLIHEIGHIFGLRHFFANIKETSRRSEIFGDHSPFTIMNYGQMSQLTDTDKSDLKTLYRMVWSGQLRDINGTRVVQVEPYHRYAEAK